MAIENETTSRQTLRLYRDLADWYPLLTPVGDYVDAAAFYRRLFETHCRRPPRTLLDLGRGGGAARASRGAQRRSSRSRSTTSASTTARSPRSATPAPRLAALRCDPAHGSPARRRPAAAQRGQTANLRHRVRRRVQEEHPVTALARKPPRELRLVNQDRKRVYALPERNRVIENH